MPGRDLESSEALVQNRSTASMSSSRLLRERTFTFVWSTLVTAGTKPKPQDRNKDTDLLENGLEDMGRGWGEM